VLCARVLAKDLSIDELITASTEELASTEMKMRREQVKEEALKDIVLAADVPAQADTGEDAPTGMTSERAAKICIESSTTKGAIPSPTASSFRFKSEDDGGYDSSQEDGGLATSNSNEPAISETTKQILQALPPPPMSSSAKGSKKHYTPKDNDYPSPSSSPLLEPSSSNDGTVSKSSRAQHIMSKSGTEHFQITISKLKLTFTTKIAEEASCAYELDGFLPSMMKEKGRLPIDDFNKFITEKTRSGKWTVAHLKLSSLSGDNMTTYKKFYKEYESLGRLTMIQVSDTTKIFLITPKFLRICNCLRDVENLSRSSTYVVVLTKETLPLRQREASIDEQPSEDLDDMF